MNKLLIVCLCAIHLNSYAKETLESTVSGPIVSFSTGTIPEHASVRVDCDFNMHKNYAEEFYAYVTPYAGTFHIMAHEFSSVPHPQSFYKEIGSKVYMPQSSWSNQYQKSISIIGVTQNNESIIIDLSHAPSRMTVSCSY